MTQNLNELLALANQAAEEGPDMNVAVKGGGGGRLLPEGYAFGVLVEYIEYGNQPQEYQGKAKEPALEFQLGFALTGEGYSNEDGTPYIMRPWPMAMSQNEKARAFLLFKALNWKGTAKHFAQLLGQKFLVKIETVQPKAGSNGKPRSAIDLKGFLPPLDPVTKMPYPIADARPEDLKLFLWSHPDLATFHSFYQEGEYEAKDGMPARSKNVVQEKMLSALDFHGSPLQQLLVSNGVQYKVPQPVPKAVAPAAPSAAAPAGPTPAAPPAAPALPSTPAMPASVPAAAPAPASAPAVAATPAPSMPSAPVVAAVPSAAPAMPSAPAVPAMPAMPAAA